MVGLLEIGVCLLGLEILPVKYDLRGDLLERVQERFNEEIIGIVLDALVAPALVVLIAEEPLIVGAEVEEDVEDVVWIYSTAKRVDLALSEANFDSSEALIADSENSIRVRHN